MISATARRGSPVSLAPSSRRAPSSSPPAIRRRNLPTKSCKAAALSSGGSPSSCCPTPDLRLDGARAHHRCRICRRYCHCRRACRRARHRRRRGSTARSNVDVEFGQGFSIDLQLTSEHLGPVAPATVLELDDRFRSGRERDRERIRTAWADPRAVCVAEEVACHRGARCDGPGAGGARPQPSRNRPARRCVEADGCRLREPASFSRTSRSRRARRSSAPSLVAASIPSNRRCSAGRNECASRRRERSSSIRVEIVPRSINAARGSRARPIGFAISPMIANTRCGVRPASPGPGASSASAARSSFETSARVAEAKAAVATLQASLASGVVAGGGSVLVREASRLRAGVSRGSELTRLADACVARGLEAVATHIARNAGFDARPPLEPLRASTDRDDRLRRPRPVVSEMSSPQASRIRFRSPVVFSCEQCPLRRQCSELRH